MKGQVLVVDDEQETCDLLEMALVRHGFKVTTSSHAQRALELVAAQDFDVVLTDLSMPEMSGLDLCERVLGTRPNMPVVVITGQGSLETAIGAIRVGAYDFITKPVDPKHVKRVTGDSGATVELDGWEITFPFQAGEAATIRKVRR